MECMIDINMCVYINVYVFKICKTWKTSIRRIFKETSELHKIKIRVACQIQSTPGLSVRNIAIGSVSLAHLGSQALADNQKIVPPELKHSKIVPLGQRLSELQTPVPVEFVPRVCACECLFVLWVCECECLFVLRVCACECLFVLRVCACATGVCV